MNEIHPVSVINEILSTGKDYGLSKFEKMRLFSHAWQIIIKNRRDLPEDQSKWMEYLRQKDLISSTILDNEARAICSERRIRCHVLVFGPENHGKTTLTASICNALATYGQAYPRSYENIKELVWEKELALELGRKSRPHVAYMDFSIPKTQGKERKYPFNTRNERSYLLMDCPTYHDFRLHFLEWMPSRLLNMGLLVIREDAEFDGEILRKYVTLSRQYELHPLIVFLNIDSTVGSGDIELEERTEKIIAESDYHKTYRFIRGDIISAYNASISDYPEDEEAQKEKKELLKPIWQLLEALDTYQFNTLRKYQHFGESHIRIENYIHLCEQRFEEKLEA